MCYSMKHGFNQIQRIQLADQISLTQCHLTNHLKVTISIMYNGTVDLLPTQRNISTVTIRSTTVMVVDPITANPVAGESFTITGSIASDNGSALQLRNGDPLSANVLFRINGDASGFTLSDGVIQPDGHGMQQSPYHQDLLLVAMLLRLNTSLQ